MNADNIDVGTCKVVDVSKIKPSKFNVREQDESVKTAEFLELCESIKENGLIEPIILRRIDNDGLYEAVAGSRRLRALKHIGIKEAPTIVRKMSDNDARIASLVENIHRESLEYEEKKQAIEDIYKSAGYTDLDIVKYWLLRIYNERHKKKHGIIRTPNKSGNKPIREGPPEEFKQLCKRIAYGSSYQYQILSGKVYRPDEDQDFLEQLYGNKRDIIKEEPELKKHPLLQQKLAKQVKYYSEPEVKQTVKQAVHDLRTGAMTKNTRSGGYELDLRKQERIEAQPELEKTPVRAREEIIDHCKALFKLVTGSSLEATEDVTDAERVAQSKDAQRKMKELITEQLGMRELGVFEHSVAPLAVALTKLSRMLDDVEG